MYGVLYRLYRPEAAQTPTGRSQLNDGEVGEYCAGQYWVEPPGAEPTLTNNPSQTMPARRVHRSDGRTAN